LLPTFAADIAGEVYWRLLGAINLESYLIAPFELVVF